MTRQTTRPLTEPEIRQLRSRCRHFTGVQNETCEAGVRYDEARGVNPEGRRGPLPCLPDTSLTVPRAHGGVPLAPELGPGTRSSPSRPRSKTP